MKQENVLRWLVSGQFLVLLFLAFVAEPGPTYTATESLLWSFGFFVALDVVALAVAYLAIRRYDFNSFWAFLKGVW